MSALRIAPYLGFVSGTFQKMLAYRLRYYTGIVSYLIYVAINYFIWKAVFADREPGALINGYDLAGMTTYVAVAGSARSFYQQRRPGSATRCRRASRARAGAAGLLPGDGDRERDR